MDTENIKKMASDHWDYVANVLKAHGENDAIIEKCGHHYKTAFFHGYKHCHELNEQS